MTQPRKIATISFESTSPEIGEDSLNFFLFLSQESSQLPKTTEPTPIVFRKPKIVQPQPIQLATPIAMARAKPFPKTTNSIRPPPNFPPPLPLPPLQLQNLLTNKVKALGQESTPQGFAKQTCFTPQEVLHYPKSTAKSRPHVFDTSFMKEAVIPDFDNQKVPKITPRNRLRR